MQLQIGDRMTDSTGEWEVVGRPYTTLGGKNVNVRVQRVDKPGVTEIRGWGAYEKVSVRRATVDSPREGPPGDARWQVAHPKARPHCRRAKWRRGNTGIR